MFIILYFVTYFNIDATLCYKMHAPFLIDNSMNMNLKNFSYNETNFAEDYQDNSWLKSFSFELRKSEILAKNWRKFKLFKPWGHMMVHICQMTQRFICKQCKRLYQVKFLYWFQFFQGNLLGLSQGSGCAKPTNRGTHPIL